MLQLLISFPFPLSVNEGGLANSAFLVTLCLNVDHPTGGFMTVGDGILSMEGLELGLSTLTNSSSQSDELHQQHVSLHLTQNLQYFPKKSLTCFTSPSDSVWVVVFVCVGLVKIDGGYLNPWPVGISVSEALSSVCLLVVLQGALLFLDLIGFLWAFSHMQYFSILVWVSWIMVNFPHVALTFDCTFKAPVGILQHRYSFRSQAALSELLL